MYSPDDLDIDQFANIRVCPLKKPFSFKSAKNAREGHWLGKMADTIALSPLTALSRLCSVFVSASVNGNDKDDRQ